ncbi:ferrochelatase [Aestuariirhabdus litorea]|uniref:Ferrochelatase n=1 Tax=Aestuariirhabdus litorea TaxID=2528527 RepID=A0A3P3VMM8_9GAMM|nr:ferrochelatase [Aestuariirhabdus litorea]RRJ82979.1 ferrochelatase [Aestuariirhabdus litorea]RWW93139.1 ferrochelatase [Endozoicomonadaceae bacterium GTF-13]
MSTPAPKTALLLLNLGSPDELSPAALRRYLREFLSDRRVIEAPRLVWWFVLNGVILPFRPRKLMHAYGNIWTEQGSPIRTISLQQQHALQSELNRRLGDGQVQVELAMTYGNPSITAAFERLEQAGVERVLVLPLFPQYSATTTAACFDAIARALAGRRNIPELRFIRQYHEQPAYIEALANSVREHWQQQGRQGHLMFSFHGLPLSYVEKGDPYPRQCEATVEAVVRQLGLSEQEWTLCYQSRVGIAPWLQPYTDETLIEWAKEGRSGVDVICPGFSADCLETLEEVAITNKELFEEAGGSDYQYIPALNASSAHIQLLADTAVKQLGGWLDP